MTDFLFGFYQFLMNYLFGKFQKVKKEETAQREVLIYPIYAVSMLRNILLN